MIKDSRLRKKIKIRKKIHGSANNPRITIYRSLRSLYVQVIDDDSARTLCSAFVKGKKNQEAAAELADVISVKLKENSIVKAKLDRNGYKFGAVMKSFVEGLREYSIQI